MRVLGRLKGCCSEVVRYRSGESQVPHIDTSDVTMLLYLTESGGRTCFPHLGVSSSTSSNSYKMT